VGDSSPHGLWQVGLLPKTPVNIPREGRMDLATDGSGGDQAITALARDGTTVNFDVSNSSGGSTVIKLASLDGRVWASAFTTGVHAIFAIVPRDSVPTWH
jgi:hypothetical protein